MRTTARPNRRIANTPVSPVPAALPAAVNEDAVPAGNPVPPALRALALDSDAAIVEGAWSLVANEGDTRLPQLPVPGCDIIVVAPDSGRGPRAVRHKPTDTIFLFVRCGMERQDAAYLIARLTTPEFLPRCLMQA